jgi:ATP-dependent Clp protease ATP-binding subunit ClpA
MFERFTSRARHVVVLAQEEARGLQHNYIGSEHLLLGLLGEPESIAGRVLLMFGMSLDQARQDVAGKVGRGKKPMEGHIPFTPRSKKVLELALREAMALGHNYIGTEHVLLGVVRQGEGPAVEIIAERSGDLAKVRAAVLAAIPAQPASSGPRWSRRPDPGSLAVPGPGEELRTTPAADASLNAAVRLAGLRPVGSHHLLLAALSDPDSAAVRAFTAVGIDLGRARDALRDVDVTGTHDEPPEEAGRRTMIIRTTQDRLTIEAADPTLIDLARAAIEALADQGGDEPGTLRGDVPAAVSLGNVWQALRDSLEDIRRRATASAAGPATTATTPAAAASPATLADVTDVPDVTDEPKEPPA